MTRVWVDVLLPQVMHPVRYVWGQPIGLTYVWDCAQNPSVGQWVRAPFRHKTCDGVVWAIHPTSDPPRDIPLDRIKPINHSYDRPPLSPTMMRWMAWMSEYYMIPCEAVLKMVWGGMDLYRKPPKSFAGAVSEPTHRACLSPQQQKIVHAFDPCHPGFSVQVLHGVTGSGKTAIYLDWARQAIQQGKQVAVLVPEIGLCAPLLQRWTQNFDPCPLPHWAWHSGLGVLDRRQAWFAAAGGVPGLWVGTRSSLCLPWTQLGLVVIDEEHDPSYKQDEFPRYHAKDAMMMRAKTQDMPVVLSSATPSIETMVHVRQGRYQYHMLDQRYFGTALPDITSIDMRIHRPAWPDMLSPPMIEMIRGAVERQEQVLLFLNRRGYAPLLLCKTCGYRWACPHCSTWLVVHVHKKRLICHRCGYQTRLAPVCPQQQDPAQPHHLMPFGHGLERLVEEVQRHFPMPTDRIVALSRDQSQDENHWIKVLDRITQHDVDIILATQILAKGYHFPHLRWIGIVDGDAGFQSLDLKAQERHFALMQQVAGRAGRQHGTGHVLIQTHDPDHPVLRHLMQHDFMGFVHDEMRLRQQGGDPPFARLAQITLAGIHESQTYDWAQKLAHVQPSGAGLEILGPIPAPLFRLRGRYRFQWTLRAQRTFPLQSTIALWLQSISIPHALQCSVDIDPITLLGA